MVPRAGFEPALSDLESDALPVEQTEHKEELLAIFSPLSDTYVGNVLFISCILRL